MLTILVEYLVAARKTGPGGVGAGQPPCMTGGSGRRGRHVGVWAQRPHPATGGLAAWLAPVGGHGWLAGAGGPANVGGCGHGRRCARRRAGAGEGGRAGAGEGKRGR